MKTKLSLTLGMIAFAAMAMAAVEPTVAVVSGSSKNVFKVVYKSELSTKVKVTIFNSDGKKVFTEEINNEKSFARPYNFSSLPEGEYVIEIEDELGKKSEKINYTLAPKNQPTSLMAVRKLTNFSSKYLITASAKGESKVNVSVYDTNGELLHSETHVANGNFGIVYSLPSEGYHTFVLTDNKGNSQSFIF
ncbi:MAG: T9SS type A sorting domain-containing protein [Bacteroidetes bacterium]|nr:T9SS type A sorting domain-containing protein [Bacteroidota bacterium]